MWWETLLVFTILALAGGYAGRRIWRTLVRRQACCNCGQADCGGRQGDASQPPATPAAQGNGDAA